MKIAAETDKVSSGDKTLLSQTLDLDETLGYSCYRYDVVSEDSEFAFDFHQYSCIDPLLTFVVYLQYSQRSPLGVDPANISKEGDGFITSLKFVSPAVKRTSEKPPERIKGNDSETNITE
jgi:hypothetical protein